MTFTASNTEGTYSSAELELMNRALEHMLEGTDPTMGADLEGSFSDIISNNFSDTSINTIQSLTA